MNRRPLLSYAALCTVGLVLSITSVFAQTTSSVIGSGAVSASSGTTRLTATIGQSAIGFTAATSTEASQGFWFARTTAQPSLSQEGLVHSSVLTLAGAPNPLSRSTTLTFQVPARGHVSLVIYDAIGRQVMTVVDGERDAGTVAEKADLSGLSSGKYTAVLRIGDQQGTTSLLLVD